MPIFNAKNSSLTKSQEATFLTASAAAAATSITVKNNNGFAQNDYFIIGKIGSENAEMKQVNAAVTAGTALTTTALTFAHNIDEPIYRIAYNQVEFSRATTLTGSKSVLTTINIQPDDEYTRYDDTANTTGFCFIRFKNSTTSSFSPYSDGIAYTGYTTKSLRNIRKEVRRMLNETDELNSNISNDDINEEINDKQKEIAHERLWSFYEATKSFSSVANQYQYDLASDVSKVYGIIFDTQPLAKIDKNRWDTLRWDSDVSGDPTHCVIWNNKALVYPYPTSSATATTVNGAHTATVTTITLASNSGLPAQGRIYVTDGTNTEVISYTAKSGTTQLTGCTRGEEGTTAYALGNGDTATKRDFLYNYHKEPTDLSNPSDETSIPEPRILALGAAMELALRLEKETLHDRLKIKYTEALTKLRQRFSIKQDYGFSVVKDDSEIVRDWGVFRDPNRYPKDLA